MLYALVFTWDGDVERITVAGLFFAARSAVRRITNGYDRVTPI